MSDLISKKEAIKAIVKQTCYDNADQIKYACNRNYEKDNGWLGGLKEALEAVESLPSAEPERKWIPVTEALPKNAEFVLLTIRRLDKSYSQIPFISVGYVSWNQNAWWCAHDGDCDAHNVEVLAWMPLPERWRGE